MADFWSVLGLVALAALGFMAVVWGICRQLNNAGFVDVAWSYGIGFCVVVALVSRWPGHANAWLLGTMMLLASARLGTYLLFRVAAHHPEEDGRYAELRKQFPRRTWLMFFGFFELQAILLILLSVPFIAVLVDPFPVVSIWSWLGLGLWVIALLGESVADRQLQNFRSNPANRGRTCMVGLWRYSRHPNYFFQWCLWLAYWLYACGAPGGWMTIYCPALMLFFLFRVTGIPVTEAHALKSRGDEYRRYQETTSAFFPWFPRQS